MTGLTPEQRLLMFVGSGEKRRLTPTEGGLLRLGIRQMAEQLEQARRTVGGLHSRIRELEQQLGQAEPHRVPCSRCKADVGELCKPMDGTEQPATPHTARLTAAAKGVTA